MAILSYNEIIPKKVIVYNNEPCLVTSYHVFRKQQRKPVNITKLKGLKTGRSLEVTFHMNETVSEADLETRQITFIYRKPGEYWFHASDDKSDRFPLSDEIVGSAGQFIKAGSELDAMVYDDEVIGVQIPIKVDLKVTEAMEAVKGNTSSGAQKEIGLETGARVMAPMFINEGDVVSINTETAAYSERVAKA